MLKSGMYRVLKLLKQSNKIKVKTTLPQEKNNYTEFSDI